MKVLIVIPSAVCHGGAEAALLHLIEQREAAGLELQVCFLEDGEMVAKIEALGVVANVLQAGRLRSLASWIRTVREVRRLLLTWQPKAVLGWMTKAHLYSGPAALGTGVSALYFQMGLPDGGLVDRLSRWVPAAGALGCSAFVAAEQGAKVRHPVLGVPLAAEVGTEASSLPVKEMKRRLGFDPEKPLVGIVGRLQHWKGIHVYIKAMARVTQKNLHVQGVIVGGRHDLEPEYPDELQRLLKTECLEGRVRMVGKQTNVPEWMQAMDVVVHASQREPFGIVVIEAMALGKAVIATQPGGPEEILNDGKDGLLVPWNDHVELASNIQRLLDDPGLATQLGQHAALRSQAFTTLKYAERIGAAIRRLLELRPLSVQV